MFVPPTATEIVEVARSLGLHLSEEEAAVYEGYAAEQLAPLHDFVQSRIEQVSPPLLYPERAPGRRPTAEEDPTNAWLWKCQIGGMDRGLLAGKTVSFKDHVAVAGIPLTFNAYAMEGFVPDFDATIVTRVLAAGGTVVGKNAMNGFTGGKALGGGLGDYWAPVNPHDPGRITGGSSSGCGAALAAGEVDICFGGDQGGSIRIPAAYCGVVGLKPTFGLVSHMGVTFGSEQSVDHVGPMARTVEDVAAALETVAGYDGYDPRQGRMVPETLDVLGALHQGVDGLRIGILDEGFEGPVDVEVRDGVLEAVDVLARAGAEITKVSVPEHQRVHEAAAALGVEGGLAIRRTTMFGTWAKTYYPVSLITALDKLLAGHSDLLTPRQKIGLVLGQLAKENFHGAAYTKAQNARPAFVRAYDQALSQVDVLVMPTCLTVAPPVPEPMSPIEAVRSELERARDWPMAMVQNTRPFNYTGHPALAVPCGKAGHLPFSMQLVGRFFDDALLLRTAYAYQQAVDWDHLVAVGA